MYSSGEEIALEKRQVGTTGARVRPPPSPLTFFVDKASVLIQIGRYRDRSFILWGEETDGFLKKKRKYDSITV